MWVSPRKAYFPRLKEGMDLLQQDSIRLGLVSKITYLCHWKAYWQKVGGEQLVLQIQHSPKCFQRHQEGLSQKSCYSWYQLIQQKYAVYYLEVEEQKKIEEAAKANEKKKEFVTKEGKFRCINQGCRQDYVDKDNSETACKYHKGQAIFHDLKKYWNCCGK